MRSSARLIALSTVAWAALAGAANAQSQSPRPGETTLPEIVVTAAPYGVTRDATTIAVDVLDETALDLAPAQTLGDLLNGLPGVRSTSFSAGASRPVIRGLQGPRVQVLTNGLGLIDASALSPDHQVAVDPGDSRRIEVLRGPQTLAFGGSAIGGVVNVIDRRIPEAAPEDGLDGSLRAQGSTVDDGWSVAGELTAGRGPLVFTLDALKREAKDYDIPVPAESRRQLAAEGEPFEDTGRTTLENSFVELQSLGGGVALIGDRGLIGLSVKRTESDYGVPGHEHEHEDHGGGAGEPHEEEVVTIGLEQTRWDLRGEYALDLGPFARVRLSAAQADYEHTEFEGDEVGTRFLSDGHEGRLELVQRRNGGWNGALGLQALKRDFNAIGDEAYVPRTEITEWGIYTLQRLDLGRWGLEGGLRFDNRELDSVAGSRDFDNVSASFGVFGKPVEPLFLGVSISRNGRAPTEAELFAQGPHIATRAFEVGNRNLDSETVTSVEGTLHFDQGRIEADVHVFYAAYDGFIDLRPTGLEDVDSELEIFNYVQTDADFRGLEAEIDFRATDALTLGLGYDWVRGETDLGSPARIPPQSLTARATYTVGDITLRGQVRRVDDQSRVAANELPTDGYTTADLLASWSPANAGWTVYAEGRNLGDEEVREHASYLKDLAPLPGRNFRVGLAWRF